MTMISRFGLILSALFAASSAHAADTTIRASLWDKGPQSEMMDDARFMEQSPVSVGVPLDLQSLPLLRE